MLREASLPQNRSRRPDISPMDLPGRVAQTLGALAPPGARLCVGLSGGIDSVVLLDLVTSLAPRFQWCVSALHVNHQLSPDAAAWVRFCRRLCRDRAVPLRVAKVTVQSGDSVEAAARAARYLAYRRQAADHVLLAHHQDDQAETLLLQLLRGAGVKGLAAMPQARVDSMRPDLRLLRPMLGVTRREIEDYAAQRGLQWVHDGSNGDVHFLRNFLRREILPLLETRVPAYRMTLARAAGQMAEASQLLDELARIDGAPAPGVDTLQVSVLAALDGPRARNVLRHYLAQRQVRMPDARRLDEALRQVLTAKSGARVCVALDRCTLRRYRGALHLVGVEQSPSVSGKLRQTWHGERRVELPALNGVLHMRRRRGAGVDLEKLLSQPVTLRARHGGEKLQPEAARPRRAVKDLLQLHGVPPWCRDRLPLLWSGERLVWVAGLGIDCAFLARPGAPAVLPSWVAHKVVAEAL